MQYHINTSKAARNFVNAEVKRRNRGSLLGHTQESVSSEIINEWEESRKQSQSK